MGEMIYRFKLGNFDCTMLYDGVDDMPVYSILQDSDENEVRDALSHSPFPLIEDDFPRACLLVNTGEKQVLLDAGVGTRDGKFGLLLNSLNKAAIAPEQIDMVVLTHAHSDHFGGLLNADGQKTFPNARYLMRRDEWDYYSSEQYLQVTGEPVDLQDAFIQQLYKGFKRLAPHLELLDENQTEILPGIHLLYTPGHTKHHSCVWLHSRDDKLLFISDALLHLLQLNSPHLSRNFEYDIQQSIKTRRILIDRALRENALVAIYHAPFPGLGHLEQTDKGIIWKLLE